MVLEWDIGEASWVGVLVKKMQWTKVFSTTEFWGCGQVVAYGIVARYGVRASAMVGMIESRTKAGRKQRPSGRADRDSMVRAYWSAAWWWAWRVSSARRSRVLDKGAPEVRERSMALATAAQGGSVRRRAQASWGSAPSVRR